MITLVSLWVSAVCTNLRLLAVLDLLSLLLGLIGAVLLAFTIGDPPVSGHALTTPTGTYKGAYIMSESKWRWGIRLIILAGVLQVPKLVCSFIQAFDLR